MAKILWPGGHEDGVDFTDLPNEVFFRDTTDDGDLAPYGYKIDNHTIIWFHEDALRLWKNDDSDNRGIYTSCIPLPNMQVTLKEN